MRKEIVGNDKVFIGRLADTDVREFAFDLSEYTSCMDGTFSVSCLFVLPNKSDSEAYAIAIDHYRLEGNQLIWIPTSTECSETGWGKFEAILYNDGQQVASLIWRVQVGKSLVGDEEPPEGWENYILAVERLVDSAEASAQSASDSADEAEGWAHKAEQGASESGWIWFDIDEDGYLVMKKDNSEITFTIDEDGYLIAEVA